MKTNFLAKMAAAVAMVLSVYSYATECRAAGCQEMSDLNVILSGSDMMNSSMSDNVSWMKFCGVVSNDKTNDNKLIAQYIPSQPTYGRPEYVNPNNNPNGVKLWTECKIVKGSGNSNSGGTVNPPTYEQPKRVKCGVCSGTGRCTTCSGKGVSYHGGQYHRCGGCNGTGNCRTCNGAGWHDY